MLRKSIAAFALMFVAAAWVVAGADGLPRLDPSNGTSGTAYTVVMPASSFTMDPALVSSTFTARGTLTLFQDPGSAELDGDLQLDLNQDTILDRAFRCSGYVGMRRFGLRCSDDDGLGDFKLNMNGNAVILDNGKLALRKASGRGFTDTASLRFAFQATEQ